MLVNPPPGSASIEMVPDQGRSEHRGITAKHESHRAVHPARFRKACRKTQNHVHQHLHSHAKSAKSGSIIAPSMIKIATNRIDQARGLAPLHRQIDPSSGILNT
jgi:hypothetical protein